jgi:RNA polymerase sigma-70 factor (ECF subfamily)
MKSLHSELGNIYQRYSQAFFTCALAITRDADLAGDAVHEAFSRLLNLDGMPHNIKAYAFRSVRNAALDLMRKNGRTVSFSENYIFAASDNPRKNAERGEFKRKVSESLAKISEDERETIIQHLYADLTFREIAELRQVPLGTATSWYNRGIKQLRELLEEEK